MTLFAGLDAGTGGARCLITDERGARVSYGEWPWAYEPDETGFPTLPPDVAMRAIDGAVADALAGAPGPPSAIGVTSQRTGVVFLDDDDRELYVGPNADGRAAQEGIALERAHGERIYRVAGRLPAMLYMPARLAWARANRPAWRVARALAFSDWIVHRLTGAVATEPTQAAEMLVSDVARGAWSDELLTVLDVPRALMPPILEPGSTAGETRGGGPFPPGIAVVPAGADTQCAALAMGALTPGAAFIVAGTTMLATVARADAAPDPAGRLWTSPLPVPGRFAREAHCGEAGALVAWFADLIGVAPAGLASLADGGVPGGGGAIVVDPWPSVATDFALVRRASISFPAPVLALGRSRADVARAVFEGIAFAARAGLDVLREADGEPSSLAVAGGVARARAFAEALAGSSERSAVVASEPASSALGAAILAAASYHGGVEAAVEAMRDRGREVAPEQGHGYPAHYAAWRAQAARAAEDTLRMSQL